MKSRIWCKAAVILLAVSLPVMGVTDLQSTTQQGMNRESFTNAKKADAELNKVYKKLMGTLQDDDAKEKLKTAQRLWIKFRDAEVESEGDDNRGGSIASMVRNQCAERLTEERTTQLNDRFQP